MIFYMTFGQWTRHEQHPRFSAATADGWVAIVAKDYAAAVDIACDRFGNAVKVDGITRSGWSQLYAEKPSVEHYPCGEIGRIGDRAVSR